MIHTAYPPSTIASNVNSATKSHTTIITVDEDLADEDLKIMEWLSPLDPGRRQQDVHADRLDGVGNWLLETNKFRGWRSGEGGAGEAVLFCSGNLGAGKTYISSLVIDNLCDGPDKEDITTTMFYCDFRNQREQTTTNIMGAILKQLAARKGVLGLVRTVFRRRKAELSGRGLRSPGMVRMLKQAIATLPQVFICIDALDECLPEHLPELLGSLKDILQESPRTRIFATGRPHIEAEIRRYFAAALVVPISPKAQDIRRYLEKKLEMDTERDAMSDALRADILKIIPEKVSEIFLLVSLNIDAILGEVTITGRRQKLMEMTKGNDLGDVYAATLARMRAQEGCRSRLGMEALMWVSNSERPLHTTELCHALGVEIGSADLQLQNAPSIPTLLGCSLGLITVEPSSSTVRLVHATLQEYLSNNPSLFQNPHSMIAEVCLTYLNFQRVRALSPTLSSAPSTLPLVGYASCYWGKHIRREKTQSVSRLTLRLLIGFDQHISSHLFLLCYHKERGFDKRSGPHGFTGLHAAAFLGIAEVVAALLEMKEWDINATDAMGRTALVWATVGGHGDVVKMLLQQKDVNPNTPDTEPGRTPLLWAVEGGHESIVALLLSQGDVNPNITDTKYGQTPLLWATRGGYEGIVKSLLGREDTNPNTADTGTGQTPLGWAAEWGQEGIVELLLERGDINPNTTDTDYGRTPLWQAAKRGHEGIARMLLERGDTDPNTTDTEHGQTPLWQAAKRGHERVVKMLLERGDVDPNSADAPCGQTPLWWAAKQGHEGVVKLLLERWGIDPNTTDTLCGQTPLLGAAERGHERVVRLLLEREDVNPNTLDTAYGQTALSWAVVGGHEEVVRLLLQREDTNPNTTSLSWVAERGYERVVKMLLERADTNPGTADTESGLAPLWLAARGGHEGIVKLLLEREDINPNTTDTRYGRTPLWLAAKRGHEGVVKLLLERRDIDPNITDSLCGQTPLLGAAECGHERVVRLLLEREDVNPNTLDTLYGQAALSWAVVGGHEEVVRLLLQREDTNPNTTGAEHGLTSLSWAARSGHDGIVKLLLERVDADPNAIDTKYGRTPLAWAAKRGHEGVVKFLLSRADVNPDLPDLSGETALELAASCGYTEVVKLLSRPKPSLSILLDAGKVLVHFSIWLLCIVQTFSRPLLLVPLSPLEPLPCDTRPLRRLAIYRFATIPLAILLSFLIAYYNM